MKCFNELTMEWGERGRGLGGKMRQPPLEI